MNYFENSLNVQIPLADANLGYLNNSGIGRSGENSNSRQASKQNNVIRVESCNGNKLLENIPKQMYNKRAQSVETRTISQRNQNCAQGSILNSLNQHSDQQNDFSPNVQGGNTRIDSKNVQKDSCLNGADHFSSSYAEQQQLKFQQMRSQLNTPTFGE
ncbi:hypothetical protein ABPG72_004609 [Tetrahymena utriculariae]